MPTRPRLVTAAALALALLGGCAIQIHGNDRPHACQACNRADPGKPVVSVDGQGEIRLDSSVLAFQTGRGPYTITWRLDEKAGGYRFDAKAGIVIEGRLLDEMLRAGDRKAVLLGPQDQIVDCRVVDERATAFTCTNRATSPGIFKYTIRLIDGQGRALIKDPPIMNW